MTTTADVQNVPDVFRLLERARSLFLTDTLAKYEGMVDAQQHELLKAIDAALAQRERFVLVPKEPTEEMKMAGANAPLPAVHIDSISGRAQLSASTCYRAMLAASPKSEGKPTQCIYCLQVGIDDDHRCAGVQSR